MNSVGRRQVKMQITHAPVKARGSPKCFAESAGERLQRTVVRVQRDIRNRHLGMSQLICGSLQQQSAAHGSWSFLDHCPEQPVKLRAALIGLARQILRSRLSVERVRNDCREPICRAPTIHFSHALRSPCGEIIDKDGMPRLIVCTNFYAKRPSGRYSWNLKAADVSFGTGRSGRKASVAWASRSAAVESESLETAAAKLFARGANEFR